MSCLCILSYTIVLFFPCLFSIFLIAHLVFTKFLPLSCLFLNPIIPQEGKKEGGNVSY